MDVKAMWKHARQRVLKRSEVEKIKQEVEKKKIKKRECEEEKSASA